MAKLIIGIDFSKRKMNFCCMDSQDMRVLLEGEVENSRNGCTEMTGRLRALRRGLRSGDLLFCGENTGVYSLETAECLTSRGYFVWLESPLQIKLSSGMRRCKTDPLDARMIAEYAFRHLDLAKRFAPDGEGLKKLRELHLTRRKLKECETALRNFSGSIRGASGTAADALRSVIAEIKESIRALEKEIREMLSEEPEFRENVSLALSVPGISWVSAAAIILDTRNFSRFQTARQYANHAGCVPHEHESGSSVHRRPRVSRASNRYINSLLTQGANSLIVHNSQTNSLIVHNSQTREYAHRKRAEGKVHAVIVNNIRNKTIHRLFAVIRDRVPFDWSYSGKYKGPMTSGATNTDAV